MAERVTRAFWPLWSLILAVLGALMLGAHEVLPPEIVIAFSGLIALAGLWFLIRGLRRFRWPGVMAAIERLDTTMPGQPIQAMLDAQAIGAEDDASRLVWAAHQQRMRKRSESARAARPDLRISARDPFGMRYMALLAFMVALLFGSFWRVGTLPEAAAGGLGSAAHAAAGPSWEGWLEPPAYTGLPVLYLGDIPEGTLDAPAGSRITLRLYGAPDAYDIRQSVADVPKPPATADDEAATTQAPAQQPAQPPELVITRSGELAIEGDGGRRWDIAMIPDAAPEIDATGPAEASAIGAFTMPFEARDDYEVTGARAVIALDMERLDRRHGLALDPEPRGPIEMILPLPIARGRDDFEEVAIEDFSEHPWANMPVKITLHASDEGGNEGLSPVHETELAARHFFDPMAAAVIEMRRDLLWNRANAPRMAQVLRAVSNRPQGLFKSETTYLRLRYILRRIEASLGRDMDDERRDEIAQALWDLALQLEEGTLADALERMRQAQERLSEAMKNGASDAEIARLMDELRDATRDYMERLQREFAQNRERNGTDQPDQGQRDENTTMMTQDDLQRMMDRIQELMEQGRMAEAQQALEEFQRMMENMRIAEGQGGQGQSPGQEAMEGLSDTLREQQGLSDQAFRDLQEQFNPGANAGQNQGNEGRSGGLGRGQSHDGQGNGQGQGQQRGQGQAQNGQPGEGQQGQRQDGQQGGQGGTEGQDRAGEGQQGLGQSLADRQRALRQELNRQRGSLPGAGTEEGDAARDALDRAGRAMDGAEDALRQDDLAEAIDKQAEAMDALRDGIRSLGEALAQNSRRNPGQQGQSPQNFAGGRQSDPLGRNMRGAPGVDDNMLQGEDVYRRARDLLDEIRRRSGELARPEAERNYLERLLDRF